MLEVEVIGDALPAERVERLCAVALASADVHEGHLAVEFIGAQRMAELNANFRGRAGATDVLSFPVDETGDAHGPRELGDIVICPEHTTDLEEAVVHGVLHLTGMDHETDDGEMLALQAEILGLAAMTRSGFVALAGRPNVGKSTLTNAIVGHKVAIVSDKPQTTRRAIRGVATRPGEWQMVLCDLPGVQRPRDVLTARMQRRVEQELAECDGSLFVLDGEKGVGGPGDRWIAEALARGAGDRAVTIVLNKADRLDRPHTVVQLDRAAKLAEEFGLDAEIFPISARTGKGVGPLVEHLVAVLPEGPFYFPETEITDQREDVWLAELVREQVLHRTRQEVPHAVEVQVEEIEERDEILAVRAAIWVETESQKGILIGAGGRMIKGIGTAARKEIERELGRHVHLDLSVRVRRSWRADDALLDRLGIT